LKIRKDHCSFAVLKAVLKAPVYHLFITVRTGLLFYRNGRVYIVTLLHGEEQLTDFINKNAVNRLLFAEPGICRRND